MAAHKELDEQRATGRRVKMNDGHTMPTTSKMNTMASQVAHEEHLVWDWGQSVRSKDRRSRKRCRANGGKGKREDETVAIKTEVGLSGKEKARTVQLIALVKLNTTLAMCSLVAAKSN